MKNNNHLFACLSVFIIFLFTYAVPVCAQRKKNDNSLDGRNYVIKSGKHEVWTPKSNPLIKASDSKESQHMMLVESIIIQPGGSLTISDLFLKMSTKGRIDVYGSTSKKPTGKLVLNHVTITSRLRLHPWSGIRVLGNFAEGLDSVNLAKKGIVTINSCNLINADTTLAYLPLNK